MREMMWGEEDRGSGQFNHAWLLLTLGDMLGTVLIGYTCVYMFLTFVLLCASFCMLT